MSVSTQDGRGAALLNVASKILEVTESTGPVTLVVNNEGAGKVVVSVKNKSTGANIATDDDTAIADEDTVYNGDTSTLVFNGQVLNNLPIIPGTVVIKPAAGGNTVNGTDRDGDGKLYTSDVDEDLMGTINYGTGALSLSYPTGKAPNTGDIDADYSHASASQVARGTRSLRVGNNPPLKDLVVSAAGLDDNSIVQITAVVSF